MGIELCLIVEEGKLLDSPLMLVKGLSVLADSTPLELSHTFWIGKSVRLIVEEGKLLLGGSQGIFFLEFDGPRQRKYYVKVIEG